jgi:hypothetical protein
VSEEALTIRTVHLMEKVRRRHENRNVTPGVLDRNDHTSDAFVVWYKPIIAARMAAAIRYKARLIIASPLEGQSPCSLFLD